MRTSTWHGDDDDDDDDDDADDDADADADADDDDDDDDESKSTKPPHSWHLVILKFLKFLNLKTTCNTTSSPHSNSPTNQWFLILDANWKAIRHLEAKLIALLGLDPNTRWFSKRGSTSCGGVD